jgi:hypothetical protein
MPTAHSKTDPRVHKKEYVEWIAGAKKDETRNRKYESR